MTFDDLPECPRCKESFALVRPLASSSLDGARHVLRDDPELRLKLRDRLQRARLDRRKRNDNPLAAGPDPDAPDWFEPQVGGDNGDAEASMAPTPESGERSEEGEIVHSDDLSPEDEVRGGATTVDADGEVDIIEASREPEDDEPEFSGDVPGFTDWREELRERLKRIRARREQERLAEEEAAAAAAELEAAEDEAAEDEAPELEVAEDEAAEDEAAEDETTELEVAEDEAAEDEAAEDEATELEVAEDETAEDGAAEDEAIDVELVEAKGDEADEELDALTTGDIIARIVDGPGVDKDDQLDVAAEDSDQREDRAPDALILGEKEAEPSVAEAAEQEAEGLDTTQDEAADEAATELADDEPAGDDAVEWIVAEELDEPIAADDADEAIVEDEGETLSAADEAQVPVGEDDPADTFAWGGAEVGAEKDAADVGTDDDEKEPAEDLDEIFAATSEDEPVDTEDDEAPTADLADEEDDVVIGADEAERADEHTVMGADDDDAQDAGGGDAGDRAPELDFEPAHAARSPEIDLPEHETVGDAPVLEWDREQTRVVRATVSSAGPLGERAAAALCDALVLTAIGAALVGAASSGADVPFRQVLVEETPWLALTWAIFAVGYSVFLVGSCGQTIGRMVMRLRVIGDDQFSVGFDRAAIRLAAWVVSALPALAGMLPALRDPQRRALHDRLSHTRVVKA